MFVTVTELSDFERRLTLRFGGSPLRDAENRAARRLSHEVHVNGFRRGKAPRRMVERLVGRDRIRYEAVNEMVEGGLSDALDETGLAPAAIPEVEDIRSEEDGVEVDVRVALWPVLEAPPEYVGRRFELDGPSEEDLEAAVKRDTKDFLERFAELETVERPALDGDYAAIDVECRSGDRALAAFSAVDLLYGLGSDGLLDGLDDSLAGCSAGDIVNFASSLRYAGDGLEAGTPVDVRVLVKEVKEKRLPDLDDEWVSDYTEFDSVEEMESEVRNWLKERQKEKLRDRLEEAVVSELVDEIDVAIPAAVIGEEADRIFDRMSLQLEAQGIGFDRYLEHKGQDRDAFRLWLDNAAAGRVRAKLLLEAVAAHAGLKVEDRDLRAVYDDAAVRINQTADEVQQQMAGSLQEAAVVGDILRKKGITALMQAVVPVDRDGNVLDLGIEAWAAAGEADPDAPEEVVQAVIEPEEAAAGAAAPDMVYQAAVEPEHRER